MDRKRDKLEELVSFIRKQGIIVNIDKNSARGHKGFFAQKCDVFRIDVSKNLNNEEKTSTLLHEFAHYIHYKYEKSLESLNFIFKGLTDNEMEELLEVTVSNIPKEFVNKLYTSKEKLTNDNKELVTSIKKKYQKFKASSSNKLLDLSIMIPERYFFKYDKFKFNNRIYDIQNIKSDFLHLSKEKIDYIIYKANKRKIKSINSKINKFNKYYNQPTELWARFFELYFTDYQKILKIAPNLSLKFKNNIKISNIPEISVIQRICE